MNKFIRRSNFIFKRGTLVGLGALAFWSWLALARPATRASESPADGDALALLDRFRHVEVASVSDALEQLTGRRMYMTHKMRPIFPAKFAGFALTVLLKKEEGHQGAEALKGMLEAIDQGQPGSVYVLVVEDGNDIAGIGGLMGTAMFARNFSGAVIDGGVGMSPTFKRLPSLCSPSA